MNRSREATRRFVPLVFTDCPRIPDQAFVVSRLRITRREYFTSRLDTRSGRAFHNLFVGFTVRIESDGLTTRALKILAERHGKFDN